MGAACGPGGQDENAEEGNIDMEEAPEKANWKFAKIINDYQMENERLQGELDDLKTQNVEGLQGREEKAKLNEEVVRELNEMKDLLNKQRRAIVRGHLEAALHSKATSMLSVESKTRLVMEGELWVHYGRRPKKKKYAEIHMFPGEVLSNDFKAGWVVMTYANKKDAQTLIRCHVLAVAVKKAIKTEFAFTMKASVEGARKEITFSCEKEELRDAWTRAIMDALADVKSVYDDMHSIFTLKLEFAKEKMGICIKESLITYIPDWKDEKVSVDKPKAREDPKKSRVAEAVKTFKKVEKDFEKAVEALEDKDKAKANDDQKEELKREEKPCELLVTSISDDDLTAAGLQVNCIIREINSKKLTGMVCSEQLRLLMTTPKPYILTFTGQNFLKHKAEAKHGYFSIMKELVADGDNAVKKAFNDLIRGTPFEKELEASNDKKATIQKLLSNQRRLIALLQNFKVQEMDL